MQRASFASPDSPAAGSCGRIRATVVRKEDNYSQQQRRCHKRHYETVKIPGHSNRSLENKVSPQRASSRRVGHQHVSKEHRDGAWQEHEIW